MMTIMMMTMMVRMMMRRMTRKKRTRSRRKRAIERPSTPPVSHSLAPYSWWQRRRVQRQGSRPVCRQPGVLGYRPGCCRCHSPVHRRHRCRCPLQPRHQICSPARLRAPAPYYYRRCPRPTTCRRDPPLLLHSCDGSAVPAPWRVPREKCCCCAGDRRQSRLVHPSRAPLESHRPHTQGGSLR